MSRPKPLSGFPEFTPERPHRRAVRARPAAARPSSCTASPRSRPAPSSRSTGWPSRVRSTRRSTPSSGCTPSRAPAPSWACTSTSPCRSPATCWRTPASCAFPFRRYQIQKVWRGERPQEGRYREFTQADIDIVDAGTLAAHHDVELPLVTLGALERLHADLGVPPVLMRVNNRKLAQGFYLGLGHRRPAGRAPPGRQAGQDRPRPGDGAADRRGRRERGPGRLGGPAGPDLDGRRVLRRPGARPRRRPPPAGRGPRAAGRRGPRRAASTSRAGSSPTSRSPAASTTTPAPSTRPSWSASRAGARSPPAAATTPWPATAGRPTPASACRSASPGCWPRCWAGGSCGPPARSRRRCSWPWSRRRAAGTRWRWPSSCAPAASPAEVAPKADKFGKQIRYADRRGIPFVWFGGAEGEVKDIRSGDQVPAVAASWAAPGRGPAAAGARRRLTGPGTVSGPL